MYYSAMPLMVNITIINGLGVTGQIVGEPEWIGKVHSEFLEVGK